MQVKNLDTGEMVDVDESAFSYAIKKRIPVRYQRIKFPYEVTTLEGAMVGKAGDPLMIGIDGEMYPCDASIFDRSYGDMEYATPHFEILSRGDFANLAIKRGAKPIEAGRAMQVVEDIKQLTDGKKPVYVVELSETALQGDVDLLYAMCTATNLAIMLLPNKFMTIVGEVV